MKNFKRILLVEDNKNDVELTLNALSDYNLANGVDVVTDGAEALDYLLRREQYANRETGNPAVILLDLKLPRVSGLELLRIIKSDPLMKLIPTVILTSSREERDILEGYSLGVNAYVVKPVEFESFTKAIRDLGSFWAIVNEAPTGPY